MPSDDDTSTTTTRGQRLGRLLGRRERPGPAPAPTDGTPRDEPYRPFADAKLQDLVVITGVSGAGKSTAMAAFEDAGYFCVDNLPPEMLRSLVELFAHEGSSVERAAVVSDARGGDYFEALRAVLEDLTRLGLHHRVLFLDCEPGELLTRYQETRRRHPLAPGASVADGIAVDRELVEPLRDFADVVIDSTGLKAHMLRRKIADEFLRGLPDARLAVSFESFGFKHGPAPRDADLVFDVRFLPNPHYEPELRPLTGRDPRVVAYIDRGGQLGEFYARLDPLLDFLIPRYVAEGKSHLTVGIGCTGGRHRSVAIAEHLAARYRERDDAFVEVVHRDVDRGG
ncbi:MAG TPA: RNase adapter RapZ [Solirubrobacteraceae bacterium]|nr:RNase adapter RapZ [Solirubrobacteraceae bacterium]